MGCQDSAKSSSTRSKRSQTSILGFRNGHRDKINQDIYKHLHQETLDIDTVSTFEL